MVYTLNWQSTPGIPYNREYPTIGEWLKFNGLGCDNFQMQRLWYDTQLVLEDKWEHLMKAFIKMEPHKRSKVLSKRWRIIICFSLPVQVAWKMLFDFLNVRLLENSYDIPVQHGFQLYKGSWKQYYRQWASRGYNCGTDASAWDWTASGWLMDAVLELRFRLMRGVDSDVLAWTRIARTLYRRAFSFAKIVLPDGMVLRQNFDGLQKSGSPNTIADNSMARFIASVVVAMNMKVPLNPGRFVGDDALELHPENEEYVSMLIEEYRKIGIVIKSVEFSMEFVGHHFSGAGPRPLYVGKHLWSLAYTSRENIPAFLDSMARLYCHSNYFQMWQSLAERLGVRLFSRSYYLDWYDNEYVFHNDAPAMGILGF